VLFAKQAYEVAFEFPYFLMEANDFVDGNGCVFGKTFAVLLG
jgi:hypothetical protein